MFWIEFISLNKSAIFATILFCSDSGGSGNSTSLNASIEILSWAVAFMCFFAFWKSDCQCNVAYFWGATEKPLKESPENASCLPERSEGRSVAKSDKQYW